MNLLRNKEIRRTAVCFLLLTVLSAGGAFARDRSFGFYLLGCGLLFTLFWFISTFRRYARIRKLSLEIDRILHREIPDCSFSVCAEGELSILESEIQKMLIRLREQQQGLQEDKIYLADSIADISHQLRTPLTSINLYIQLLKEPGLPEKRRTEILRELQTLLSRIDWLIAALLKISKLDAGMVIFQKKEQSLAALIEKAAEPLQIPIELRGQELQITAEGCFTGDADWTAEAVGNIIKNCMEHTPEGGQIRITASENPLYSEILIEDTGCGIDPDDLPHIFERFYKGKNAGNMSFGIGLALARVILSEQNGTVRVKNKQEGGALFTLRFYKGTI